MTAPQIAEAKEALKRRFLEMLTKDKDKTDKIEKLLAKSPEYRSLISAAAADALQQGVAMGHSDTASTRSAAGKIGETDAKKVMAELRGQVSDGLREMVGQSLTQLDVVRSGITRQVQKCDSALVAYGQLSTKEFLSDYTTSTPIRISYDVSGVRKLSASMQERHKDLDKLSAELTEAVSSEDETTLRNAVRRFNDKIQSTQKAINSSSIEISTSLSKLKVTVDEKALRAYITQVVAKNDLKTLEESQKWIQRVLGIAGSVLKASEATDTINRAAELVNNVGHTIAKEAVVSSAGKKYEKEHTAAETRAAHDQDPLMMARTMYEGQKKALEILIQSLGTTLSGALIAAHGAGEIVMKIWDPITVTISTGITTMLDARLKQAESAIAAKNAAQAAAAQTDEGRTLQGQIEAIVMKGAEALANQAAAKAFGSGSGGAAEGGEASELLSKIAEDPSKLISTVLSWVLTPLMDKVWEIFPPKPAETVTGADITDMLNQIHIAQLPIDMAVQGSVPRVAPTITGLDDRPSDVTASAWDRFVEVNAGRTTAPNDPQARIYHVAVAVPDFGGVKVWGSYDPRSTQFSPERLDPTAFDDWSGRTIAGAGYSEGPLTGGQPAVTGTWAFVTVGTNRYVAFTDSGGTRHWGGQGDNTLGPRGTSAQLGAVVGGLRATGQQTMSGFAIG